MLRAGVLLWSGRAGEQPLAFAAGLIVDLMANFVPDCWCDRPLVNDVRAIAEQHKRWVCLCHGQVVVAVDVGDAVCVRACGPCFAAPFGSCDFDGSENAHVPFDLLIHDTRAIAVRLDVLLCHMCSVSVSFVGFIRRSRKSES